MIFHLLFITASVFILQQRHSPGYDEDTKCHLSENKCLKRAQHFLDGEHSRSHSFSFPDYSNIGQFKRFQQVNSCSCLKKIDC